MYQISQTASSARCKSCRPCENASVKKTLRSTFGGLWNALLPQACVLCGGHSGDHGICRPCQADLPWLSGPQCPVCAIPTPQGEICGACLKSPPAFDHSVAAWTYGWPMDKLIPAFKYGGQLALAQPLAEGLLTRLRQAPPPNLLLAMPLHPVRLRERGFNQSQQLAKVIANALALPLVQEGVARIKLTPPQVSLPLAERHKTMRGAFAARQDFSGCHVAIIDDVMTTGASLNELAKALKSAGATQVDCWVPARTL